MPIAPDKNHQSPPTPAGENSPPKKFSAFLPIVILLLIIIPIIFFLFKNPSKPNNQQTTESANAAIVGNENISKAEAQKLSTQCGLSYKDSVSYLVDEKVLSIWAADNKVNISDKEINDESIRIGGLHPTDCQKRTAKLNLLKQHLSDNLTKFREGKLIVVNFDHYANPHPVSVHSGVKNEADRIAKLKVDRDYADQLVKSIDSDLKSGKLSFEQAIEKVNADEKVGLKSRYSTSIQSGVFTAKDYNEKINLLHNTKVIEQIDKLQEGQFSEPFIEQENDALCDIGPDCKPEYIDLRFVIVKVDRASKNYQGTPKTVLEKIRAQYNTKIF